MLTGRKLLLADDSAAIRKVIELTFSDEGMEVVTVPDGRSAFEKMEQVGPDLVLADVYMPEVGGYELCRSIKQDERYRHTPVVLLISSFEPFDEAEARRAGADDVVTKPFQSIRQLVSRVGSLLNRSDDQPPAMREYPAMEVSPEPVVFAPTEERPSEPQVTVLVEAPIMDHVEALEPAGAACSTDLELQTADTMRLDRIVEEPAAVTIGDDDISFRDTIEFDPVPPAISHAEPEPAEIIYTDMSEPLIQTPTISTLRFDDAVLDLEDDFQGEPQVAADDVFLDLDLADTVTTKPAEATVAEEPSEQIIFEPAVPFEQAAEVERPPALQMQNEALTAPESGREPTAPLMVGEIDGLSAAAIDAIARRMVEQMSDKVIREIAWEVVPELSELLIKQKLEKPN